MVTGTLKLFLRSLKEPLITFTLWDSFVRLAEITDEMDAETLVYSLVPDLPQPNRDTLAFIMLHLQRLLNCLVQSTWSLVKSLVRSCRVANNRECKMPVPNLARIFGPVIVGHSCPDPDPESCLRETKKQQFVTLLIFMRYLNKYYL